VLAGHDRTYRSPDPRYAFLFKSYYVQGGNGGVSSRGRAATTWDVAPAREEST
jgi:hypothetical protein